MESDRLNKWLSFGANSGVLIGLALLVLEIGQNNELMLAQIEQSRSMSLVDFRRQAAMDADFSELTSRFYGLNRTDNIWQELDEHFTPVEIHRLTYLATADIYDIENVFAQYERGLVSEEYWHERMVPAIRMRVKMWKEMPTILDGGGIRQSFKDEVERILENSGEAGNP